MKPVWANDVERDAFVESNCARCFQPDEAMKRITSREAAGRSGDSDGDGCPHLARAEQNKLPTPWTRRRNAVMGETYRCADFQKRPAVNRRGTADATVEPMFCVLGNNCKGCPDIRECGFIEPDDRHLVPVDGWPDWRAEQRKTKEGDHS